MNVKEFKIHLMRGLMRPEYFYIPLFFKSTSLVRFKILDEFGDDMFISQMSMYYQTYSFSHNVSQYDEYSKGYTFNEDVDWRYPVPDPSEYEIYPIPDLGNIDISVKNGNVTKSGTSLSITFENPQTMIEIKNLPSGIYSIYVNYPSYITNTRYYPNYYDDYYKDRQPYDTSNGLIDRKGKFSGFYYQSVYENSQQIGYNFYGITKKFDDNTMPIVMYYKTWQLIINKTTEYGKRLKNIKFKLHSESGGFTSSDPLLLYASIISRNSTDIVFTTTSDRYATLVRSLQVNKDYTLTELEIPENFTGYSGDIGFHFQKTGELVCNIQNEYVSNTTDSITIKNKRVNHRVKMVIAFVDNPLLPGGYQSEFTETFLLGRTVSNESGYFKYWWKYDHSEVPEDSYSGVNQVLLYDSLSQSIYTSRDCAKVAIAKLYLDGEYKGFFTEMKMKKYDSGAYYNPKSRSIYDQYFADNWTSMGGKNKYKGMKGTYTAWCLTKPHTWDEHAFDEESHTAVYFEKDGFPYLTPCRSEISELSRRYIPYGWYYKGEMIREDPVVSEYTGNISLHELEMKSEELVSVGDIAYEGGTSSGYIPIVYNHITEVKNFLKPEKSTRNEQRVEDYISGFDIGNIDGSIQYAETHDLTEIIPTTYDDDGEILQMGSTTTTYYGEGLTSDVTSLMYQIVREEDMEVVLEV